MDQSFFWALPAAAVAVGVAAGLYGWRLKTRFERDHPKLTRAALKAESETDAQSTKAAVSNVRPFRKIGGSGQVVES